MKRVDPRTWCRLTGWMGRSLALVGILWPGWALAAPGPVLITEVYYNPPTDQGASLEFVEIQNVSASPVDLQGWSLRGGVRFTVTEETALAPGAFALICRDVDLISERLGGTVAQLLGNYDGVLDDGGEVVDLVDAEGAFVDTVPYDDEWPWSEDADGEGGSLQRICIESPGWDPLNWNGSSPPSVNAPWSGAVCPQPAYVVPPVVITEVFYHPAEGVEEHPAEEDGEDEEFVEIHNPGDAPVRLAGWRFGEGIEYVFGAEATLEAGEYLVVCRNEQAIRAKFGIVNTVGDFTGKLSNRGERILLVDALDRPVDAVSYVDHGDWPYAADGFGRSLEKIVATAPGTDPANWSTSVIEAGTFQRLSGEGGRGQGLGVKFLLSIDGPGVAIVDNVVLQDVGNPGENLLDNGTFDIDMAEWTKKGNAIESVQVDGIGVNGTGALRLVSTDFCPAGECGESHAVSQSVSVPADNSGTFRVTVDFQYVEGSPEFRAGLFRGAAAVARDFPTPGAPNSVAADRPPPWISRVLRFPREPRSTDRTWITALVRADTPPEVTLESFVGDSGESHEMFDDGQHHDGLAGDGVYGVELSEQPHNTQVRFRIAATSDGKTGMWPQPRFPGSPLAEERGGYYVNDLQVDSPLPVVHVLLDQLENPEDPEAINGVLSCFRLEKGAFAVDGDLYPEVDVRFRGNTACWLKKRNLKVIFNKVAPFRGVRKINLNGLWTDKAIIREHMAWEFFRELGIPYCETEFIRVHLNGVYHGLFMYLEHPDSSFLDRNDLASDANLYKAKQPARPVGGEIPVGVECPAEPEEIRNLWEREVNEQGDFSDVLEFVCSMHADGTTVDGPTVAFWEDRFFERMLIGYQVAQVALNNIDSFAKNHFLYHDLEDGRWGFVGWDVDLTFGKFFDLGAVGPGRPVGTLNDKLLCDSDIQGNLNPWFGSTVNGNPLLLHLVDFFLRAGVDHYQRAYLTRLWDILHEKYTNEMFDPRMDALRDFLADEEAEDFARWGRFPSNVPGFPEDMATNIEIMKDQIRCQREFLIAYIEHWHPDIPGHPSVKITELMYLPEEANSDLEFIELRNTGDRELDVSGWSIDGIGYTFPEESIVPAGFPFIVAKSPAAFEARYTGLTLPPVFGPYPGRLANEGEVLRVLDAGQDDYPATIDYLEYDNSGGWPTLLPGQSLELQDVSPTRDNDVASAWAVSETLGGTPGITEPMFVRGNADGDERDELNVTDAIYLLGFLFQGGPPPPCADAADTNDDGALNLTDGIYLLNFLFQGGPSLPPPYPAVGLDPTEDAIACAG